MGPGLIRWSKKPHENIHERSGFITLWCDQRWRATEAMDHISQWFPLISLLWSLNFEFGDFPASHVWWHKRDNISTIIVFVSLPGVSCLVPLFRIQRIPGKSFPTGPWAMAEPRSPQATHRWALQPWRAAGFGANFCQARPWAGSCCLRCDLWRELDFRWNLDHIQVDLSKWNINFLFHMELRNG